MMEKGRQTQGIEIFRTESEFGVEDEDRLVRSAETVVSICEMRANSLALEFIRQDPLEERGGLVVSHEIQAGESPIKEVGRRAGTAGRSEEKKTDDRRRGDLISRAGH